MDWISTEEKLPKLREDVLVLAYYEDKGYAILQAWRESPFSDDKWLWLHLTQDGELWNQDIDFELVVGKVTHWMPIPDYPNEK